MSGWSGWSECVSGWSECVSVWSVCVSEYLFGENTSEHKLQNGREANLFLGSEDKREKKIVCICVFVGGSV